MFRGLNPAQHAAQHARIVFLLNEALHVAFTSYNTACLLYKQTGAQRADGAVGVSLPPHVAPRLQTQKHTHSLYPKLYIASPSLVVLKHINT